MIDAEKRKTVFRLHEEGVAKKAIARLLKLDPKTVRGIIASQGATPRIVRPERIEVNPELLEQVFVRCEGWVQRTFEVLTEEYGVAIGYSTLCRRLKEMGLGDTPEKNTRFTEGELYVRPGEEMQNDTSPYLIKLGGRPTRVVACGLYLRYSKMRYVKFYLSFQRFDMKGFFYEALSHWGFSASHCIIDNTNLAILRGTGENAVMVPEMIEFARQFGFIWKAHRIGHSNRKAGKERNFWTLETNFFPGREFKSLEDLNRQAFEWSTVRYADRPHSETKQIPRELFEKEKAYLLRLPDYVEPPYRVHKRQTDPYGYVSLHGNYYWIPGIKREILKVIEYASDLKIYRGHNLLIEVGKVPADRHGEKVKPEGFPDPERGPSIKHPSAKEEESRLRRLSNTVSRYLDWIGTPAGQVRYRFQFTKSLYLFSKQITLSLLDQVLERALEYGINDLATLERMATQIMTASGKPSDSPWERETLKLDYQNRPAYREGCFADEPQIELYGKLLGGTKDGKGSSVID